MSAHPSLSHFSPAHVVLHWGMQVVNLFPEWNASRFRIWTSSFVSVTPLFHVKTLIASISNQNHYCHLYCLYSFLCVFRIFLPGEASHFFFQAFIGAGHLFWAYQCKFYGNYKLILETNIMSSSRSGLWVWEKVDNVLPTLISADYLLVGFLFVNHV